MNIYFYYKIIDITVYATLPLKKIYHGNLNSKNIIPISNF